MAMNTNSDIEKVVRQLLVATLTLGILLYFIGCEEMITPPASMRLDLNITVLDTTFLTQAIRGNSLVDSARVFINSISYRNTYDAYTDSNGIAHFEAILPDRYNVTVTKRLSAEVCSLATGSPIERILNGQLSNVAVQGKVANLTVYVQPSSPSPIVFSEVYYNGSPANPIPYYFHDQFTELYNNSYQTIYLDSLIIADVEYGYIQEDVIHAVHAYMFPGNGHDYPLLPGQLVIIAQDAADHGINHSINLLDADFEYFAPNVGDVDNPNVTNMVKLHHKYGVDFLYSVMNNALVLLKVSDPFAFGYDNFQNLLLPKSAVLDGMEYRENLEQIDYKRLDPTIDAGLTGGFERYKMKSVQRKIAYRVNGRAVLLDNNNSSIDFAVLNYPSLRFFFVPGDANP